MNPVKGTWLGIDVGSAKKKVCSFCLIESDGLDHCVVSFEQGPAGDPYPPTNTWQALIGKREPPWQPPYLKEEVDAEVGRILDRADLVKRWLETSKSLPSAVAIDAPVAFALEGDRRLTEDRSTDTFKTPTRSVFEEELGKKKDAYLRVNNFWKCVGMAIYCHLAARIDSRFADASLETLAALTCDRRRTRRRLRETFPSDVYKRANGYQGREGVAGLLSSEAREVLTRLIGVEWQAAGSARGRRPDSQTIRRLEAIRDLLKAELELEAAPEIYEMRKRPGRTGDLWDAFTCAFTACCEDHGAAKFHGGSDAIERRILRSEGAILTVKRRI